MTIEESIEETKQLYVKTCAKFPDFGSKPVEETTHMYRVSVLMTISASNGDATDWIKLTSQPLIKTKESAND